MLSNKNDKKTMKKIYIICLLGAALLFTSCSEQRTVNRTASTFLHSFFVENDFDAARAVSTRITHENINARALAFQWNPYAQENRFTRFRITNSEILRTRAVVFYTLDDDVERRLNLSKINGQWLVDMPETVSLNPDFSLTPTRVSGRGFASAMSETVRLGDVPTNQ